jgi:hypothetical protein
VGEFRLHKRVVAIFAGALLGALAFAPSALAAGTVTVEVTGGNGTVTGDGINCTQSGGPDCSETYSDECETDPKPICFSPLVTFDVSPATGFSLVSWSGCSDTSGSSCDVLVSSSRTVTAQLRDSQVPSVSLADPGAVAGNSLNLSAAASDNVGVSKVEFLLNGAVVASDVTAPYTAIVNTQTVPDGSAAVAARATDSAGNVAQTASRSVTIDHTAPTLSVSGPDGDTYGPSSTQTWTIAAGDATSGVSSVRCSVVPRGSPTSFGPCTGGSTGHSVSGLPEGAYTLTVRVTDNAGNTHDRLSGFSIDATPPQTTIASGPADGSSQTSGTATFGFSADDTAASFECRSYPAGTTPPPFGSCSAAGSHTMTGLGLGNYVFEVRAVDPAGNADQTPDSRRFSVTAAATPGDGASGGTAGGGAGTGGGGSGTQATRPDTRLELHPAKRVRRKRAKFAFTATDATATFECELDGGGFKPCSSPAKVKVGRGRHVFEVRAVNAAGPDDTPATWRWKVKKKKR